MYVMGGNKGRGYWAEKLSTDREENSKRGRKFKLKKRRKKGIKGVSEEDSSTNAYMQHVRSGIFTCNIYTHVRSGRSSKNPLTL